MTPRDCDSTLRAKLAKIAVASSQPRRVFFPPENADRLPETHLSLGLNGRQCSPIGSRRSEFLLAFICVFLLEKHDSFANDDVATP